MNDLHACLFVNADDAGLSSCKSTAPLFWCVLYSLLQSTNSHTVGLVERLANQHSFRVVSQSTPLLEFKIITNNLNTEKNFNFSRNAWF